MKKRKYFGTDGIRGTANLHPMTGEMALKLGKAVTYYFQERTQREKPLIIIGKDTRASCYMLEQAFAAGVCAQGGEAVFTGPLPTPGVAFVTQSMRANAGVMISASHNSYEDNGIKIFNQNGLKLGDESELEIEHLIDHPELLKPALGEKLGRAKRLLEVRGRYIVKVKSSIPSSLSLEGKKLVVDCANGAAWRIGAQVFEELGAEVIAYGVEPNGKNINLNCGATSPQNCAHLVKQHKADMGICLDGDGDRLVAIDERGEIIPGDQTLGILAKFCLSREGQGFSKEVVGTQMSNLGLESYLKKLDLSLWRADVGDRYIVQRMLESGSMIGGEPSGHLILRRHSFTGDGMIAALKMIEASHYYQSSLAEMRRDIVMLPQKVESITISHKLPLSEIDSVQTILKECESDLGDEGRVLLRYSGTEPKVRIMLEANNEEKVTFWTQKIRTGLLEALT